MTEPCGVSITTEAITHTIAEATDDKTTEPASKGDSLAVDTVVDLQELLSGGGADLRQYSRRVAAQLRRAENASIGDYVRQSCHITALHEQLAASDATLARMEATLRTFQCDLAGISDEIARLQRHSVSMNTRLKRHLAVGAQITQLVDELTVPEATVRLLVDAAVTQPEFGEQLRVLDHKLTCVRELGARGDALAACGDVLPVLRRLRTKAVAKVRTFLLEKIAAFRRPLANFHVPQSSLLQHKACWAFLYAHAQQAAAEVRHEYVDTTSKVYCTYFQQYCGRLSRLLHAHAPTRYDMLAADEESTAAASAAAAVTPRSLLASISRGHQPPPPPPALRHSSNTVFSLGDRASVLRQLEEPAIVPHVTAASAAAAEVRYPIEQVFRSCQYVLADNACREYLFVGEFFAPAFASSTPSSSSTSTAAAASPTAGDVAQSAGSAVQQLFGAVFGRSLAAVTRHTQSLMSGCHDTIGLLLCVHLTQRLHLLCHKRAVPALDSHWHRQLQLLWPPFERVVELNVESVRACDAGAMRLPDARPTAITRRYAEYAAAIVCINEQYPAERVHRLLMRLRVEMENLLLRQAAEFVERRDQLVFLINNYDLIAGVMTERTGAAVTADTSAFRQLLARRCDEYVDSVLLATHFGALVRLVKDGEVALDSGAAWRLAEEAEQRAVARMIASFNENWRQALRDINSQVMQLFSNFSNGSAILQDALKRLLIYCDRFHKLVANVQQLRPFRGQLVNVHTVMLEVKKYKPNF